MSNLKITVEDHPKAEERRKIFDGLHRYNASQTNDADCPSLTVFLRDEEDNILGGLLGETYCGWLNVEFMWIEEAFRGQGYGEKLLAAAEREAIKRGCVAAYLDTFSFQALEFYERCGYEVFGTLEEFPPGHQRFFMRKSLKVCSGGEPPNNSLNRSANSAAFIRQLEGLFSCFRARLIRALETAWMLRHEASRKNLPALVPQPRGGLTWASTRPDSARMLSDSLNGYLVACGRVMPGVRFLLNE